MKKIMKKVLSLMLALVMVVSLAPMTAKAADPTVLDTQTISDVEAGGTGEYYYLPEGYGTYSVKVEGEGEFTVGIYDVPMSNMPTKIVSTEGVVETEITTNMMLSSISLMVLNGSDSVQDYAVTVTSTNAEIGGGNEDTNALKVGANSVDVTVENYYCEGTQVTFTAEEAGTYVLSPATGETNADVGVLDDYGIEWVTLPYEFDAEEGETVTFVVCTTAYMTLTEDTIDLVIEKATAGNENVLVVGNNSVDVTVENYYCEGTQVTFTAEETGTYVLSPAEGENNADIGVLDTYGIEWVTLPYEFDAEEGETVTFVVCTTAYMTLTEDTIDLVIEKATAGNENVLVVGNNSVDVTVENYYCEGTQVTFTAEEDGTYVLSPAEGENNADIGVLDAYGIEWVTLPYEFDAAEGEKVTFVVCTTAYMTLTEDTIDLVIAKGEKAPVVYEGSGTEEDPYIMLMGENAVTFELADTYAYFKYTATEKGALMLTMNCDSWFYDGYVNDSGEQFINANKTWETTANESTEENANALRTLYLEAGDVVIFRVSTASVDWTRPAGTVEFNAFFMAGAEPEDGDEDKDEYVVSDAVLVLGENVVELDPTAETTVFEFNPEEAGVYVFTTDNGVLGYWGAGSYFVSDYTGEDKETTLEYNLENVGPSIMVGVTGAEGEATITVKLAGEAETKPVIPTIIYENLVVPEYSDEFEVIPTNVVDVYDTVKDQAFLGEDGYCHLNDVDGPVLFVNLHGTTISLLEAYGYGRLNGVIVDDDDKTIAIVDFNTAFEEYYAAASDNYYYPLTEDLATILQAVGANEGWYEEGGFVGGTYPNDDAWMFACYYDENITSLETEVEEAEDDGKMNVEIKGESSKVTAESFEIIAALNEDTAVVLEVEVGDEVVTFEFAADSLALVDGKETYDFSVELIDDYAEATEDKANIEKDKFVLRVNFNYEGKLPATATISIPVGTDYANKTLYYYQILADGTLKYVCDAKVDAKGIAKVTQDHCSDYVLLAEKPAEAGDGTVAPGGTTTGDSTNIALWIAVLGLGVVAIAGSVVMRKREF